MNKRLLVVCIVLGAMLLALSGRAAYVQLLGHEELKEAADMQQLITLEGANTRGLIYDRNNTPLIGNNREYIYIIQADRFRRETEQLLASLDAEEVRESNRSYQVYRSQHYDRSTGKKLIAQSGAYIIEAGRRHSDLQVAAHILGYVNSRDTSGVTGLELMYDKELSMLNKKISAIADVKGRIIPGKGLVVVTDMDGDSYVKEGIVTTLDAGLQRAVEQVLSGEEKGAAAVVLHSKTGEILASASTPAFNPNKVDTYMNSKKNELFNKVTQGEYAPGSVFKIAVAAAALEAGVRPEDTFSCDGEVVLDGRTVKCKTGGSTGHGRITFQDAFAQSCNSAFIQIGQEVGAERIVRMADRLSLGRRAMEGYPQEKAGHVMTSQEAAGLGIANLSIGQGEMLTTPLQIARMTNIIAQDGRDMGIKLVIDNEGKSGKSVLSEEIAKEIKSMMAEVINSGSGRELFSHVSMAAKTGSAESVAVGREVVHGWITGFVPANEPQYTITVFVEDGQSGSESAGPVFEKIAEYLSESGSLDIPVGF